MPQGFRMTALAASLLALGFAVTATAQNTTPSGSASPKAASAPASGAKASGAIAAGDRKFMEKAAVDGMAEVELGKLAQDKASTDAVKQFGARMATDHTKANDELKQLATSKGVTLPTAPDKSHQKKMEELSKKGNKFDHEYMELMVKEHKKDVSEFRKEAKSAKDPDLQAFASKTLPTLEEHLKLAQDTAKAAKATKK